MQEKFPWFFQLAWRSQMRFGIIGMGRMGRSLREFFLAAGQEVRSIDRDGSPLDLVRESNIIIISVPMDAAPGVIRSLRGLTKDHLVIDISSVMGPSFESLRELTCESACLHPLFGPETIDPRGQNIILVPVRKGEKYRWLLQFLGDSRALVTETTLASHDEAMAVVQSLVHFSNLALADAIASRIPKEMERYSTSLLRTNQSIFRRLLSQSPDMLRDIQFRNPASQKILRSYVLGCQSLLKSVEEKDSDAFKKAIRDALPVLDALPEEGLASRRKIIAEDKEALALLGPRGSFTDHAAGIFLVRSGKKDVRLYLDTIGDVIRLVSQGKVRSGIIPIENSIQGTVTEALDRIYEDGLTITHAITIPISHCAAVHPENEKVRFILSHPHALGQCAGYIRKRFPDARLLPMQSTSEAFQHISVRGQKDAIAIGPRLAAEIYGLKVKDEGIEDEKNNKTRFYVISRDRPIVVEGSKVSLAILPYHEKQGILCSMLQAFDAGKINLTRIESRPVKDQLGRYVFYIDLESSWEEPRVQDAVKAIRKAIGEVTLMGCYNDLAD